MPIPPYSLPIRYPLLGKTPVWPPSSILEEELRNRRPPMNRRRVCYCVRTSPPRSCWSPSGSVVVGGNPLAVAVLGWVQRIVFELPFVVGLLLAAIIVPTNPVSVVQSREDQH